MILELSKVHPGVRLLLRALPSATTGELEWVPRDKARYSTAYIAGPHCNRHSIGREVTPVNPLVVLGVPLNGPASVADYWLVETDPDIIDRVIAEAGR